MSEFCPRCTSPLESAQDPARLCEVCGWFGDYVEALSAPPKLRATNPVLAVTQCLELYRDVCRKELIVEQIYSAGNATNQDIRAVRVARRHATEAIIALFADVLTRSQQATSRPGAKRVLHRIQGIVPWPADWTDYHYNASREPCDNLVGPCSCGAWHYENEAWVQALLKKHNTEISDE